MQASMILELLASDTFFGPFLRACYTAGFEDGKQEENKKFQDILMKGHGAVHLQYPRPGNPVKGMMIVQVETSAEAFDEVANGIEQGLSDHEALSLFHFREECGGGEFTDEGTVRFRTNGDHSQDGSTETPLETTPTVTRDWYEPRWTRGRELANQTRETASPSDRATGEAGTNN